MNDQTTAEQLQAFINDMQARHVAQDAILKALVSRLFASDGDIDGLLSSLEQQALHTLKNAGEDYLYHGKAPVQAFFDSIRKARLAETTAFAPPTRHQ